MNPPAQADRPPGQGAIRNLLVHLDGTPASAGRLRAARAIARRFGAHVHAQFCAESSLGSLRLAIAESPAALFETQAAAALERARRWFAQEAGGRATATWLEPAGDDAAEAFLRQARAADLVLMGTRDAAAHAADAAPAGLLESVLLHAGRPLLVVPADVPDWDAAADVLVGWNGSGQAAHAVAAALPWLQAAGRVHVLVSREAAAASAGDGLDLRGALRRHGIDAMLHPDDGHASHDDAAGERLAALATRLGAGLLVMGGYGRGRLEELVLGGATASMLRAAPLPVLMAH